MIEISNKVKWKANGLCSGCGGPREDTFFLTCEKCRKTARGYSSAWKDRRVACGLCVKCSVNHPMYGHRICALCDGRTEEIFQEIRRKEEEYQTLRLEVMAAYGGAICASCGRDDYHSLCIDHVFGGGSAHIRVIRSHGYSGLVEWLKDKGFPPGFQVLCGSCNLAKESNLGLCPCHPDRLQCSITHDEYTEMMKSLLGYNRLGDEKIAVVTAKKEKPLADSKINQKRKFEGMCDFVVSVIKHPMTMGEILRHKEGRAFGAWNRDKMKRVLPVLISQDRIFCIKKKAGRSPALYMTPDDYDIPGREEEDFC